MSNISTSTSEVLPCNLNGSFGIGVQGLLAFTAFCVLIAKRMKEPKHERRPVVVWFCDTSKQAIGAMLIHFANVFLAEWSHETDECTWYFINYLLDTTFGLLVIWFVLKLFHFVATKKGWIRLKMGEYGNPPEFKTWFYQCIAYICVMLVEKVVILILFQFHFWSQVKKFILKPFSGHPNIELFLVMFVVPIIMNALMFWVIDNFLMKKQRKFLNTSGLSQQDDDDDTRDLGVHYHSKQYYGVSDDEVAMNLINNESKDMLINGSDSDHVHRRTDSTSR